MNNECPIVKFNITLENAEYMVYNNPEFYPYAFEYYLSSGEMPYGTAKARTGDPHQWIFDRVCAEIGPV